MLCDWVGYLFKNFKKCKVVRSSSPMCSRLASLSTTTLDIFFKMNFNIEIVFDLMV